MSVFMVYSPCYIAGPELVIAVATTKELGIQLFIEYCKENPELLPNYDVLLLQVPLNNRLNICHWKQCPEIVVNVLDRTEYPPFLETEVVPKYKWNNSTWELLE